MNIPFGTISISSQTKILLKKIIESQRFSSGKYVRELEKEFARIVNVEEAVAVSSGTDADALALAVLYDFGAKRGDEVIIPALSFVATANAVLQAGFNPIFVDVELETLNINPLLIERAITKKTKAIMPVHLMGKPAKMDLINRIAKKHNLIVIEDAAEAHGAVYKGRNIGTWGDMAAYSLYVAHIITTVEGGMVVTGRQDFAEVLRSLRCHGRACKCKVCVINTKSKYCEKRFKYNRDIRFVFERIGFSAKMNELEAAFGLGCLKSYKKIIAKRRRNLLTMINKLKDFDEYFITIHEESHEEIGPHAFPLIIRKNSPFTRDELTCYLEQKGIETRDLFASIPTQYPSYNFLGRKLKEFPNAEYIGNNGLHIGVHQDIGEQQIDYFFETLKYFLTTHIK